MGHSRAGNKLNLRGKLRGGGGGFEGLGRKSTLLDDVHLDLHWKLSIIMTTSGFGIRHALY